MILTGKCKEDFKKWKIANNYIYVTTYSKSYNIIENALIIEFFDSVKVSGFKSLWSSCFGNYDVFKDNWNEHIEQAIKKANKIYNENR